MGVRRLVRVWTCGSLAGAGRQFRMQRDAPPGSRAARRRSRAGGGVGGQVVDRVVDPVGRVGREPVAFGGQAGEQSVDRVRVEPEQAHGGAGRATDRAVRAGHRRVEWAEPGGCRHQAERHRLVRTGHRQRRPGRAGAEDRPTGPEQRPALGPRRAAQRGRGRTRVQPVVQFETGTRPAQAAAANAAPTRPVVASRPRRNSASPARSRNRPAATADSSPPEWACEPAGSRPSASTSSVARRRTCAFRRGSSAGPSATRPPVPARSPSPSIRTVKVSGSTSIRGSASLSGMSALPRDAYVRHRGQAPTQPDPLTELVLDRGRRDEGEAGLRPAPCRTRRTSGGAAPAAGSGSRRSASPICAHAIMPPLITRCGRTPKKRRIPEHQVGELARLDRADLAVDAVRDRRADRVLGHVPPGPQVVRGPVTGQRAAPWPSSRARSARCGG